MITSFINYLRYNRGLSDDTCKAYEKSLRKFVAYARDKQPGVKWSTLKKETIDNYVHDCVQAGEARTSIKLYISTLRTLYKTMMALGYTGDNPARYVSTPKLKKTLPKPIEKEAIKKAIETSSPRTRAILSILYETGIRISELMALNKGTDIDPTNQRINIKGKGKKERVVYYGDLTAATLNDLELDGMTAREIRWDVWHALKPYSNAKQLSPHAIRHTYACTMLQNGADIKVIQALLGHESVKTTERYAQVAGQQIATQYKQYSPKL